MQQSLRGEDKLRSFYRLMALTSGSVILITTFYGLIEAARQYLTTGIITVGETLVTIDFPFPYFAKPVTYLSIGLVVWWYSVNKLYEDQILRMSPLKKEILALVALVVAFGSIYEVFYNFMVWNALITADVIRGQLRIDLLNINYPNPKIPWNLVFATKMFSSLFFMSFYSFILLRRSSRK